VRAAQALFPRFTGMEGIVMNMHGTLRLFVSLLAVSVPSLAAEPAAVLGDLDALHPQKLSKEQLDQLLPGARMSRVTSAGSTHFWTNEPGGAFMISTDNRSRAATSTMVQSTSSPGTWHISPEGKYCVTIEWKRVPTEDWCRYVFKTDDGYYFSRSDQNRAEKVYRYEVGGK
jgi:hypothetical protein